MEQIKCKNCFCNYKSFSAEPEWLSKKKHKYCYKKRKQYSELCEFIERMNKLHGTNVQYEKLPN
jgi:hypothetical protein